MHTQTMRYALIVAVLFTVGCSDSPTAPTAATTTQPSISTTPATILPPVVTPSAYTIAGRVTATNGGQTLSGLDVSISGFAPVTTESDGRFSLDVAPRAATYRIGITGSAIVPRQVSITVTGSMSIAVDAIVNAAPFDLTFYRNFVRYAYDTRGTTFALAHFSQAPRIYLRTIHDNGTAIDQTTLDQTASALESAAGEMTGRFGLAGIERGTGSRQGQDGWITIHWANTTDNLCGRAYSIGQEGSRLDLYTNRSNCGCGRYRMAPRVVKHELGHALGFTHTDSVNDLMWGGTWPLSQCEMGMSSRERYHAAIAYSRPSGNIDPDIDP